METDEANSPLNSAFRMSCFPWKHEEIDITRLQIITHYKNWITSANGFQFKQQPTLKTSVAGSLFPPSP
jgi:hypothetical protein